MDRMVVRMHADLESWLAEATSREFWTRLNPELKLGQDQVAPLFEVDDAWRQELWSELLTEGYFHLGPRLPADHVARMAAAVRRLHAERIPPVFMYVYDDCYNLHGYLGAFLRALLGPGFRVLPDLWAWHVEPGPTSKGWRPHRDRDYSALRPNGLPKSLSIWVPLTDATTWNGCMYVMPASRDHNFKAKIKKYDVPNLQDIRALPAPAGSVLGWNQALLHWSGRSSSRATEPRLSFSIEYQRGDEPPFNEPLLDPAVLPPFDRRLGLIGKQMLQYRHMYHVGPGFERVAEKLVAKYPIQ
jgi:phytanoyl-CoA dioxygenase PhyH